MDTTIQDTSTPEIRDLLRLQAVPFLLATELRNSYKDINDEYLIFHDQLEGDILEKLSLELEDSKCDLSEEIKFYMEYWNWRYLIVEGCFEEYYAKPQNTASTNIDFFGNLFLLQPDQCFPLVGDWNNGWCSTAGRVLPSLNIGGESGIKETSETVTGYASIAEYRKAHFID